MFALTSSSATFCLLLLFPLLFRPKNELEGNIIMAFELAAYDSSLLTVSNEDLFLTPVPFRLPSMRKRALGPTLMARLLVG